ncbi:D-alanine--D-alanine ligase [Geopsychrobacter electrodiphilus]|uniref:D-alanine--D-alanine ligase n=1 Tax=Geopsychrobacter electrodiphilus TaxID=225196 RepID=UPI000379241B|nr:D-alanine--D-alanine ligase [Geopsychrobacter electrodiphilus]
MTLIEKAEMKTRTIGVLYGGISAEREISLKTGTAVLNALVAEGYKAVGIDVGLNLPIQLRDAGIEVAFIALHGRFGEDGRVQGLLEMLQIPYTGSGVLASSLSIDKVATKQMLLYHELPTPGFQVLKGENAAEKVINTCRHLPLVVKPSREGSTIGISIVHSLEALRHGIDTAAALDGTVLIEEYIDGQELTVSVLNGEALPVIQIVPKTGFYDFHAKYTVGQTEYLLPAPIDAGVYSRVQEAAVEACRVLGCRGAARVDFMLREKEFYCLEVNTIPGMTETSLLPKAAKAAGLEFAELVESILLDADLDK